MADTALPIGGLPSAGALQPTDRFELERPGVGQDPATGHHTTFADIAAAAAGSAQTGDMLLTVRDPGGQWLEQGSVYAQSAYPDLFALVGLLGDGPPGAAFTSIAGWSTRAVNDYAMISKDEIIGVGNNTIWRSEDSGVTWSSYALTGNWQRVYSLASGVYVSANGSVRRSTNRGESFGANINPAGFSSSAAPAVYQSGSRIFLMTSGDNGRYSDNYGVSWSSMITGGNLIVTLLPLGNGVIVGFPFSNNFAMRSENNGATWPTTITLPSNSSGASGVLGVALGNGVGIISGTGGILRTTNAGSSFTQAYSGTSANRPDTFVVDGRVYTFVFNGIVHSDTMGAGFVGPVRVTNSSIWYMSRAGLVVPNSANGTAASISPYLYNYDPATMFRTPRVTDVRGYIKP